jgi:CIC family chloride channel protein
MQTVFAIVDDRNRLTGVVDFDRIRHVAFNTFRVKHSTLQEITIPPPEIISIEDSMETIIEKFESTHSEYLPVLKDGKYHGLMYKCNLLVAYREKLKEMVIE